MAQLQKAMFGLPDEVVDKHNRSVRDSFAYLLEATGGSGGGAAEEVDQEEIQNRRSVPQRAVAAPVAFPPDSCRRRRC